MTSKKVISQLLEMPRAVLGDQTGTAPNEFRVAVSGGTLWIKPEEGAADADRIVVKLTPDQISLLVGSQKAFSQVTVTIDPWSVKRYGEVTDFTRHLESIDEFKELVTSAVKDKYLIVQWTRHDHPISIKCQEPDLVRALDQLGVIHAEDQFCAMRASDALELPLIEILVSPPGSYLTNTLYALTDRKTLEKVIREVNRKSGVAESASGLINQLLEMPRITHGGISDAPMSEPNDFVVRFRRDEKLAIRPALGMSPAYNESIVVKLSPSEYQNISRAEGGKLGLIEVTINPWSVSRHIEPEAAARLEACKEFKDIVTSAVKGRYIVIPRDVGSTIVLNCSLDQVMDVLDKLQVSYSGDRETARQAAWQLGLPLSHVDVRGPDGHGGATDELWALMDRETSQKVMRTVSRSNGLSESPELVHDPSYDNNGTHFNVSRSIGRDIIHIQPFGTTSSTRRVALSPKLIAELPSDFSFDIDSDATRLYTHMADLESVELLKGNVEFMSLVKANLWPIKWMGKINASTPILSDAKLLTLMKTADALGLHYTRDSRTAIRASTRLKLPISELEASSGMVLFVVADTDDVEKLLRLASRNSSS